MANADVYKAPDTSDSEDDEVYFVQPALDDSFKQNDARVGASDRSCPTVATLEQDVLAESDDDEVFFDQPSVDEEEVVAPVLDALEADSSHTSIEAVQLIQRVWRGYRDRRLIQARHAAAICVQRVARGFMLRRQLAEVLSEAHVLRVNAAATVIQSHWRRRRAQMEFLRSMESVRMMQRHWKMRMVAKRKQQELEEALRLVDAVTRIQSLWRGRMSRRSLKAEIANRKRKEEMRSILSSTRSARANRAKKSLPLSSTAATTASPKSHGIDFTEHNMELSPIPASPARLPARLQSVPLPVSPLQMPAMPSSSSSPQLEPLSKVKERLQSMRSRRNPFLSPPNKRAASTTLAASPARRSPPDRVDPEKRQFTTPPRSSMSESDSSNDEARDTVDIEKQQQQQQPLPSRLPVRRTQLPTPRNLRIMMRRGTPKRSGTRARRHALGGPSPSPAQTKPKHTEVQTTKEEAQPSVVRERSDDASVQAVDIASAPIQDLAKPKPQDNRSDGVQLKPEKVDSKVSVLSDHETTQLQTGLKPPLTKARALGTSRLGGDKRSTNQLVERPEQSKTLTPVRPPREARPSLTDVLTPLSRRPKVVSPLSSPHELAAGEPSSTPSQPNRSSSLPQLSGPVSTMGILPTESKEAQKPVRATSDQSSALSQLRQQMRSTAASAKTSRSENRSLVWRDFSTSFKESLTDDKNYERKPATPSRAPKQGILKARPASAAAVSGSGPPSNKDSNPRAESASATFARRARLVQSPGRKQSNGINSTTALGAFRSRAPLSASLAFSVSGVESSPFKPRDPECRSRDDASDKENVVTKAPKRSALGSTNLGSLPAFANMGGPARRTKTKVSSLTSKFGAASRRVGAP